mmetsp:Transcript_4199/g.10177  ORF Transcript_4199/g.10177 Transcript_4199/m.10177 type:complete len:629 (+) Transcript_4199:1618-3504(+)
MTCTGETTRWDTSSIRRGRRKQKPEDALRFWRDFFLNPEEKGLEMQNVESETPDSMEAINAQANDRRTQDRKPVLSTLKEYLDDPWMAWYFLFMSIIAVATQISVRFFQEFQSAKSLQRNSSPTRRHQEESTIPNAYPTGGLNFARFWKGIFRKPRQAAISNDDSLSPSQCGPFDEVCASRLLDYSDAVSYNADTHTFYTILKDYMLYVLYFFALYAVAHTRLKRYQRANQTKNISRKLNPAESQDVDLDWDESAQDDETLPFALCTFTVCVSLGSVLLVPLTIFDALLRKYVSGEDMYGGLGSTNVGVLWELLFSLSNMCHYLIIPFSFLYIESEGFGGSRGRSFFSRLRETTMTLILILILMWLLLYILQKLSLLHVERLAFSYLLTASIGSCIFLVSAPFGFERLIYYAVQKVNHDLMKDGSEAVIEQLERESLIWRNEIADDPSITQNVDPYATSEKRAPLFHSVVINLQNFLGIAISLIMPSTVLLRVVIFQFLGTTSHLPLSLLMSMHSSKIMQSTFFIDAISAVYDMTLVWYVWRATWHGLQNVPYISDLCFPSRARGLTIRELCVHCLLYLCVGTSFPLVACTLGLTHIEHVRNNSATEYFQRHSVRTIFNLVFMAASCW